VDIAIQEFWLEIMDSRKLNTVLGLRMGRSKTANIYVANEIERRYGGKAIHANSLMPSGVMTGPQNHFSETERKMMGPQPICKSPEQGAATTVLAAVGKEWEGVGGKFLEACEEALLLGTEWSWQESGYVAHAFDEKWRRDFGLTYCKWWG
jgi:hypothetical protein